MPEPKVVISCGACASTGGIFRGMYNCEGGIDQYIPVDVYVCGCGTRPEQIIDGVVQALGILEKKTKELEESVKLQRPAINEDSQINRRNIAAEIIKPA
jgi:Ni,Fe-hydrogenase III small subunit